MPMEDRLVEMKYKEYRGARWKWDVLNDILPMDIKPLVAAIVPPSSNVKKDTLVWNDENDGAFSLALATTLVRGPIAMPLTQD
ncbi:hypothetical protein RIF29_15341 [Crotalaria pallida]|uniref:Uncharacterized protein n=1 Tax=Crotalaria pallida TaxID=3830 RepID=A0AAN9FJY8_CROPI